jgi:hypothetical protein
MDIASNGKWVLGQGYTQTCPWSVQKCWQNFVYHETVPGKFAEWNPTIINDKEWAEMPEGA